MEEVGFGLKNAAGLHCWLTVICFPLRDKLKTEMRICLSCEHRHDREDWICPACHNKPARHLNFLSFAPEIAVDQVRFKAEYYGQLAEVEEENFWFRARNRLLTWALELYFPSARSLLEIGCGTGFVLRGFRSTFPALKLTGSEVICEGLLFASQRVPEATLIQMDACRIPFENEFDVVGAFDVLEHIKEDEIVLQQMYQAVKPGGGIIVTVPQHPWLWSEMDKVSGHWRRYGRKELQQKVRKAAFRVVSVRSFVSLLLPLMVGARLVKKRRVADDMSEFRIGRVLNRCLEKVMRLEYWLIRAGMSVPAGGSLLLIARKA
jgi:SAM-dependent methyltransferase